MRAPRLGHTARMHADQAHQHHGRRSGEGARVLHRRARLPEEARLPGRRVPLDHGRRRRKAPTTSSSRSSRTPTRPARRSSRRCSRRASRSPRSRSTTSTAEYARLSAQRRRVHAGADAGRPGHDRGLRRHLRQPDPAVPEALGVGSVFTLLAAGEAERGHLFAVAHEQHIAGDHGVVPRLALDAGHARDLREAVRRRADQRELAILGDARAADPDRPAAAAARCRSGRPSTCACRRRRRCTTGCCRRSRRRGPCGSRSR